MSIDLGPRKTHNPLQLQIVMEDILCPKTQTKLRPLLHSSCQEWAGWLQGHHGGPQVENRIHQERQVVLIMPGMQLGKDGSPVNKSVVVPTKMVTIFI